MNNSMKEKTLLMPETILTLVENHTMNNELSTAKNTLMQEVETACDVQARNVCIGEMSEYDKAVEVDTNWKISRSPILNKEVLEMIDSAGNRLYAWIVVGENRKNQIEMYQQYRNGNFSSMIKMKQSEIIIASQAKSYTDIKLRKTADNILIKYLKEYLDIYQGDEDEIINFGEVIDMLCSNISKMPRYNNDFAEVEFAEVFRKIVDTINSVCSLDLEHRAYYALTDDEIEYIASSVGLKKADMLRMLKDHNLLYLTPSSSGFQTNVRVKAPSGESGTEWRYCITRDEKLEKRLEQKSQFDF